MAPNLKKRLEEVMRAKGWKRSDLVKIAEVSSGAVSQWLGKGNQVVEQINKMEAAARLAEASGFSALWIAQGVGPKMTPTTGSTPPPTPPRDFSDRSEVTESQHALLDELKWLPEEEIEQIRARAAHYKRLASVVIEERMAMAADATKRVARKGG